MEQAITSTSMFLNRVPNFKGTEEAAERLAKTDEFQRAKSVCINADKAQEKIQYLTVQAKKLLLVQIPLFIRKGLIKAIQIPSELPEDQVSKLTSRTAIGAYGKTVPLSEERKVDIVVMGSIAVTKQGQRIGKGEGFADIEYAMMLKLGMITPDTLVVTTVHDSQVYENLPEELFKDHDVGVDMIVTPTQVIQVTPKPPKSSGLDWSLLSSRRLKIFPILRQLREKDVSAGDTSELKEDSDVESRPPRPRRPRQPRPRSRPRSGAEGEAGEEGDEDVEGGPPTGKSLGKARRPRRHTGTQPDENESQDSRPRRSQRGRPGRPAGRPRAAVDFSLRVSNIASDVRVRDLKNALAECNVKPVNIKWRGQNGFALLHFARTGGQDSVLEALRCLKLTAAEGATINVEPMVTRIEVTDEITSV